MSDLASIPYVDGLVQEYLLFRGFTATWKAFSAEQASDCSCEFQANRLADLILRDLIPGGKGRELVEALDFVAMRLFGHLPPAHQMLAQKLETAVLQLYLVTAVRVGAYERALAFFSANGERLLRGPTAGEWGRWFALPYLSQEAAEAEFPAHFTKQWAALTEASLRNFLGEAVRSLRLPSLLAWRRDRELRESLQRRLADAEARAEALQRQLKAAEEAAGKQAADASGLRSAVGERTAAGAGLGAVVGAAGGGQGGSATAAAAAAAGQLASTLEAATPERQPSGGQAGPEGESLTAARTDRRPPSGASKAASLGDSGASLATVAMLQGHDASVICCSFSPNGGNVATGAADGVVRIWAPDALPAPEPGREALLQCGAPVSALAWDGRSGKLMLVGTKRGKGVKCWHLDTKHMVASGLAAAAADAQPSEVLALATSPADPTFATSTGVPGASTDWTPIADGPLLSHVLRIAVVARQNPPGLHGQDGSGVLSLWNVRTFKRTANLPAPAPVASLAFSHDGTLLAGLATDGCVRLFDASSREPAASWQAGGRHASGRPSVHWLADGHMLATLSAVGQLQTWDLRQPAEPVALGSLDVAAGASRAYGMAVEPDGSRIVVDSGSTLRFVDVSAARRLAASGKTVQLQHDAAAGTQQPSVDWHRGGGMLVCARGRTAIVARVWGDDTMAAHYVPVGNRYK